MKNGWITLRGGDRINIFRTMPFYLVHLGCLAAFFLKFHWSYLIVCLALYYVRMFFVTAGYHRYFSHRSFKTSRAFQFVMALMATTSTQKGVLWWAANHRHHHRYSDTEEDLHSPSLRGFLWSHVGWILSDDTTTRKVELIPDFDKYPELRWLNKYHVVPPVVLAVSMFLIGGWGMLVWGYCISTVILWHSSFTINSLSHIFGTPPLRDHRFQQEQRGSGAADHGRRLAQQPPSLHGFGAPGLLLVGSGHHLLRAVRALVVPHRLGFAPAASAYLAQYHSLSPSRDRTRNSLLKTQSIHSKSPRIGPMRGLLLYGPREICYGMSLRLAGGTTPFKRRYTTICP